MNKLLKRPKQTQDIELPAKFQKFNLSENPFPSEPSVNKESNDKRINGEIYEIEIRKKEYSQIEENFLKAPQSNPTHLRLGYVIDSSYIGRGNGKSAFLVNLQQTINNEYCLDISEDINKCFSIYMTPEPGARSKTFSSFVDLLFASILDSKIISNCLATLRLEAIGNIYPDFDPFKNGQTETELIDNLNSKDWFEKQNFDHSQIAEHIYQNDFLQNVPSTFPLFAGRGSFLKHFVTQYDFENHYLNSLKKGKERLDFVFTHLVRLFQAANFNGSYILVDDFERILAFQSARQKKDFALELRSALFDGSYASAKYGFYVLFLVLHAGVERLISDAWAESGMENRAPISLQKSAKHIVIFDKLSRDHVFLLLQKYLSEYRISGASPSPLFPFTEEAISIISEISEYNAAKILKMSYDLLEKAADLSDQEIIDDSFVRNNIDVQTGTEEKNLPTIGNEESLDLIKKASSKD